MEQPFRFHAAKYSDFLPEFEDIFSAIFPLEQGIISFCLLFW
jgi:hypothetical protein